jgi:hypothetical protein
MDNLVRFTYQKPRSTTALTWGNRDTMKKKNLTEVFIVMVDDVEAVIVLHTATINSTVEIVRNALVKLQRTRCKKLSIRYAQVSGAGNPLTRCIVARSSRSVVAEATFEPGYSASTHRRAIDELAGWVAQSLAEAKKVSSHASR